MQPESSRPRELGFPLVEVMVVIVILGILATIVTTNVRVGADTARPETAKMQVLELEKIATAYYKANARLPDTWQQLVARDSSGKQWLDANEPPIDPWGNEYLLLRGAGAGHVVIVSLGPDRQAGSEDDITSENARR